jgi:hypothetical protein
MNAYLYSLIALEVANERTREAEQHWLAQAVAGVAPERPSRLRRPIARLLAAVSLGSASIVRRLDECVADDLGRNLAPAD